VNEVQVEITFAPDKDGGTKGLLTAMHGDEVLHSDRMDVAKDRQRTAFLNKLKKRCPSIDPEEVQQRMLNEAYRIAQAANQPPSEPPAELDVSRIVRPHLFHVPEASGLLISMAEAYRGRIDGKWLLYVQWAGGGRECMDLPDYLEPANGPRIWFSPKPPTPLPTTMSRWSQQSRAKWLEGYTPKLDDLFIRVAGRFLDLLEFPTADTTGTVYTLSLWTMLTYTYPVWPAVPYLSVGGSLSSGKSRLLEVLGLLIHNPIHSSNITAPSLFRTLHTQGGTVLFDEAERLNDRTPDAGEVRSILLAGYKRGGQATRLEKIGDGFQPTSFEVYGPKAIAGISSMPPALASRCIRMTMFRASKTSPVPRRRVDPTAAIWTELRDDLHCMALSYGPRLTAMADWLPDCKNLNGRNLELWLPILAIAKAVEEAGMEGLVKAVEQYAMSSIESVHEDVVPEVDEVLLRLLRQGMADKPWGLTAGEILETAQKDEPALFARYSSRGVGAVFNRYGIKSQPSGGKRYFRPDEKQWKAIEESYGIDFELKGPDEGTNDTK
jgi:hypothetical protein